MRHARLLVLAGHPRESGPSDYEMEIRTRRADDREEPPGAGAEVSELASGRKLFIAKASQVSHLWSKITLERDTLKLVLTISINSLMAQ